MYITINIFLCQFYLEKEKAFVFPKFLNNFSLKQIVFRLRTFARGIPLMIIVYLKYHLNSSSKSSLFPSSSYHFERVIKSSKVFGYLNFIINN